MYENRYTKDSYYTYIEAYNKNDKLQSKTKNDVSINKCLE